jgi:cyanate permease
MYANYFGRSSLGRIRGLGEAGVLLGQGTGPVIVGILFEIQGSYSMIFWVFVALSLTCSLVVLKAKAPVKRAATVAAG